MVLYEKILGFKSKVKMIEYGKVTDKLTDINRARIETLKLKSKNSEVMIELLQFKNKKINGKKIIIFRESELHILQ